MLYRQYCSLLDWSAELDRECCFESNLDYYYSSIEALKEGHQGYQLLHLEQSVKKYPFNIFILEDPSRDLHHADGFCVNSMHFFTKSAIYTIPTALLPINLVRTSARISINRLNESFEVK